MTPPPTWRNRRRRPFYARGGYLGYVAGQPDDRALVPRVDLTPDIVDIPKLPDLMSGRVPGRTSPEQTAWFMNIGAIGPQFSAVTAAVYERAREAGLGHEIPTELSSRTYAPDSNRRVASPGPRPASSFPQNRRVKTAHGYRNDTVTHTVICLLRVPPGSAN